MLDGGGYRGGCTEIYAEHGQNMVTCWMSIEVVYGVEHGQKMVKHKRKQLTTNVLGKISGVF